MAEEPLATGGPQEARADGLRPTTRSGRLGWLAQNLSSGLVVGLLSVTLTISLAALIYGGDLEPYLGRGLGLVLLGGVILGVMVALLSSVPGMVPNVQDAPAAVLGTLATALGSQLVNGSPLAADERFFTTLAVVAVTTVATGAFFLLFGLFRLGNLVRYLPYPVLGGFMAGTGWLLLTGGIGIMANVRPSLSYLTDLFAPGALQLWLPGVALAVTLLALARRYRHFLVWPAAIALVTLIFYLVMALTGGSPASWRAAGLLLGPFPTGSLLAPPGAAELALVRWDVVAMHLPTVATVVFICLIALLLNAVGVEKETGRKTDLNRELRAAGLGNLLGGAVGGSPGYHALSFTAFNLTAGTGSRFSSLVAAGVLLLCLLAGAGVVALLPKLVVGGLVAYFGLKFLYDWVYQALFDLPLGDYLVILAILGVIVAAGVLPGVGVGLALTVALFVVSSSRIDAVRYAVGGGELRSRVTRGPEERAWLDERRDEILVIQLQGFLFFGTATALLERLERRVRAGAPVKYVLLDFSRVSGVDATGLATIAEAFDLGRSEGFDLLLSAVAAPLFRRLSRPWRGAAVGGPAHFARLDDALEHVEERQLARLGERDPRRTEVEAVAYYSAPAFDFASLRPYLRRTELGAGEVLVRKGKPAEEIYFLVDGQMTAYAESEDGGRTRLETLRSGGLLGELAFYRGGERSATVTADRDSTLYVLSAAELERLTGEQPALAAALHRRVARLMADRVLHLMAAVDALER